MENKQTAIDYIVNVVNSCIAPDYIPNEIVNQAKQMEKEQMIKFAQIVIDNTCGDYDGNVVILKPIEDIYNETYKQQDNE